ncbi:MAG: leucyl/phenylalanyl-tRNA--protein transferase [Saprospiraceae bacterium]|uniref:Leucyl/phenylalanyl-tRNA--protein transferase n=1 Tax=Candidatus Defluviibacterium haderslevense TaxID=2981993 RepID=A0A9D7S8V7_9BACT|nr:leucyl/phenylalanyl-tRNA--protein transferase [Candidatus Defluviibacterium haderslevense]
MPVFHIPEDEIIFPHPSQAEPDGLLGIGGDLKISRLLLAYQNGIFPWYSEGEPIMWWCLTPRLILRPQQVVISKSMRSLLRRSFFRVSFDTHFKDVMIACQNISREGQEGTWIHANLISAFCELHEKGLAHSVEVWHNEELVGGLYGLAIGKMFCGESMFAKISNASKFGLICLSQLLVQKGFELIDCQQETPHLKSMGAELMNAEDFFNFLETNKTYKIQPVKWKSTS